MTKRPGLCGGLRRLPACCTVQGVLTSRKIRAILKWEFFWHCCQTGREGMGKKRAAREESGRSHCEMLLRQYPWLNDRLEGEEIPIALSHRKPERLFGGALLFIGGFALVDTLLHLSAFGVLSSLMILLVGTAMAYAGIWVLCFASRGYVLVTSRRVVYQKVDLLGRPGKALSISRGEILRARFMKSTVMYRADRSDGGVCLSLKNGKTLVLPSLCDAETILDALG